MTWIVGNSGIKGGSSMSVLLMLSSVVCGLLTVLILFYLNGYVIKQRSREFGLYSVLGLGKGNLCLLLFWEILFSCIGSLICGILAGAVFSQLMYLLLLNITRLPVDLEIWVPMGAVNITVYLFWRPGGSFCCAMWSASSAAIPSRSSGAPPRVSRNPGPAGSLR